MINNKCWFLNNIDEICVRLSFQVSNKEIMCNAKMYVAIFIYEGIEYNEYADKCAENN